MALAAMAVLLAMSAAQAAAEDLVTEGEHEFVKVTAPTRAMAAQLAVDYDVAYATGDRTATVVATPEEQARLRAAGYTGRRDGRGSGDDRRPPRPSARPTSAPSGAPRRSRSRASRPT